MDTDRHRSERNRTEEKLFFRKSVLIRVHPWLTSRPQNGSAVLVILVFLSIIAILIVSNSKTLYGLDKNIRLIEQQQLKKYGVSVTNTAVQPNKN